MIVVSVDDRNFVYPFANPLSLHQLYEAQIRCIQSVTRSVHQLFECRCFEVHTHVGLIGKIFSLHRVVVILEVV